MTRFVLLLAAIALLGACGDSPGAGGAPAPDGSTATEARDVTGSLPWPADLAIPELRTVGDVPPGAVVVVIREDGAFEWKGEVVTHSELSRVLGEAEDGPVLIASHRDAPWGAAQAVMIACAVAELTQLFHAATPATGGAPGAFATPLPTDRGFKPLSATTGAPPRVVVKVTTEWPPSDVLGVHAPLAAQRGAVVEIDAAPSATVSRVLRIADVAALEGAAALTFVGAVYTWSDWEARLAEWRSADRARHLRVNGEEISGPPPLIPAGARVTGRTAGFDVPYEEPWPPEEEPPPAEDPQEERGSPDGG